MSDNSTTYFCTIEDIPMWNVVFGDHGQLLIKVSENELMSFPEKFYYYHKEGENFEVPTKETLFNHLNFKMI